VSPILGGSRVSAGRKFLWGFPQELDLCGDLLPTAEERVRRISAGSISVGISEEISTVEEEAQRRRL